MSSSPETSPRITGADQARREARDRAAARKLAQRPPGRYEPYLDGLFTYCLSVLCGHDTATAALVDRTAEERDVVGRDGKRRRWSRDGDVPGGEPMRFPQSPPTGEPSGFGSLPARAMSRSTTVS